MLAKVKISLAQLYLRDLQPEAAVELLRPVLPAARGHVDRDLRAGSVMARALNHAGHHERALRVLDGLRDRHAGLEEIESIERAILAFDTTSSRTFREITRAWRTGREGEPVRAMEAFDALRDAGHDAGLTHFGEASMYFDLARYSVAERHFREAAEVGIERPSILVPLTYIRLGNLLDLRDERREAKSFYRKASGAADEHPWLREAAKHYLNEPFENRPGGVRYP